MARTLKPSRGEPGPGADQWAVQGLVDVICLAHITFVSVLGNTIYTLEDFTYKSEVLAFYNIERSGMTEPHSHAEATGGERASYSSLRAFQLLISVIDP